MKLITQRQREMMVVNGIASAAGGDIDPLPVVKLFMPDGGATWLLTELDPEDEDIAFGLCDLGMQCPELGSVRLSEIAAVRGALGLPVEHGRQFRLEKPLSLTREAARIGCIIAWPGAV